MSSDGLSQAFAQSRVVVFGDVMVRRTLPRQRVSHREAVPPNGSSETRRRCLRAPGWASRHCGVGFTAPRWELTDTGAVHAD